MNKKLYATAIICMLVGLYLPQFMQMPVTILIMGSVVTYIAMNTEEFFGRGKKNG